jgi:DNA mismatch endonuclease, patch repair protein
MADFLSKSERSARMARIPSRNTAPEKALRKELHSRGFRFRLHNAGLPGKPDLVFPRYKTVVFVHGCFWHRHKGCNISTTPKSNVEFWQAKFDRNTERDLEVRRALLRQGWQVLVAWECELQSNLRVKATANALAGRIRAGI